MHPVGEIGFEVKMLSNCIRRRLDEMLVQSGIRHVTGMQGMIMAYLFHHENEQDIFQRDVEQTFRIRRSTATGLMKLMERDGIITREPVSYDARLKKLKLTPQAFHDRGIVEEEIQGMEKQLRTGLDEEEIKTFLSLLLRIRKNVE